MSVDRDEGGEPVCWMDRLCSDCGALLEPTATTCWRCSKPRHSPEDDPYDEQR